MFAKYRIFILMAAMVAIFALVACGSSAPAPEPQIIEREVIVEKPVTEIVEVEKEVIVEKPVTEVREVEKEVVVENKVTEVVEVEKEVVVEKEVEVEVEKIVEVEVMAPEGPKETIIFSDLNWTSAQVQNRVAQYIVEKGYGYPTDVVFGSTLPLFQGLRKGDTHVTLEIWLPNQNEAWEEAINNGEVVSVGSSLGKDWQSSFVIPAYLQEQYPDLDSVEDLKDQQYKDLFKTAETGDKARVVACVIGWACEEVGAQQILGYGLTDHVEVINAGDNAALNADLYGAYEKEEAWLGYQWGTNEPALVLDLVRLGEPEYSLTCWLTDKACAYEDATILIAVHPDLPSRAPDVIEMLRKWDFNIDLYKEVAAWQRTNSVTDNNATALWWLNSFPNVWGEWVSDEAASAVKAALAAGETPDGWPDS